MLHARSAISSARDTKRAQATGVVSELFLDACALIYLLEGQEPFAARVRTTLAGFLRHEPGLSVTLSRLTWLECRVGPMKRQDSVLLDLYDTFFAQSGLRWIELSSDVVELAAAIRVRHGLRTPDALQAACCLQLGEHHRFLTGDTAFQQVAGLNVVLLS